MQLTTALNSHKKREDELNQAFERLRTEKESAIRSVTREKEDARLVYEVRINELELLSKRQENSLTELRSVILELRS